MKFRQSYEENVRSPQAEQLWQGKGKRSKAKIKGVKPLLHVGMDSAVHPGMVIKTGILESSTPGFESRYYHWLLHDPGPIT